MCRVEPGVALEGGPAEPGVHDRHPREAEVDEGGAGEVEADPRPEGQPGRGWTELVILRGPSRAAEVVGEEALGGLADLELLPGGVPSRP
jgi:hypothetical protein